MAYVVGAWLICGVLASIMAGSKRRVGCGFVLLNILLGPFALLAAMFLGLTDRESQYKNCPSCTETIKKDATKCRFCGEDVTATIPSGTRREHTVPLLLQTIGFAAIVAVAYFMFCTGDPADKSRPTTSARQITSLTVPGEAYIDGRDLEAQPPLTLSRINIWDSPARKRVVCSMKHGQLVELLTVEYKDSEQRRYFEVRAGSCRGWLPEVFLNIAYEPPVGDMQ